ncbi:hypothetical protein JJJ17_15005 [Paracoccus caeni]|uniref:Peptidase M48 Ste24p n=1 Tax=Paracoccus caeni TaxID=657651 RepID=A0A934SGK6_9RHOB|nr:hypothetical protein [Paracoccus caeni]MBK4217238.1 hypothetical protein [Paracoccus caeni]
MTTALTEFQRLESQGSWRETPDARLREVVVSVGSATLILSDPKSDSPLSHWSLPAVTRLNPGKMPAIYAPGPDATDETVEIDDQLMIDAIERVHRAIESHRAHPGRLRGGMTILAVLAMLAAAIFWLPDAIIRHAAHISPPAQARAVGKAILTDMERSTGAACKRASGQAVLDYLTPRLIGDDAQVHVVPVPISGARRLPGNVYVLGNDLLRAAPGPETAAAHLIAAKLAVEDDTLRLEAMSYAGFLSAMRLMTLGTLSSDAMTGFAEGLLQQPPQRPQDDRLLAELRQRGIAAEPYARSLDPTGQSVLALIEGDPARTGGQLKSLLTAEQWRALQQICAG